MCDISIDVEKKTSEGKRLFPDFLNLQSLIGGQYQFLVAYLFIKSEHYGSWGECMTRLGMICKSSQLTVIVNEESVIGSLKSIVSYPPKLNYLEDKGCNDSYKCS